ncbi:MAG TPA: hypothetical protein PKL65_09615 [Bacteroidales bacterium]|nr:hypothetical protein [Bacteroidales bacterium]HPM19240.1 hypothetical protein [Bacteroidales bacterium]
MREQRAWQHLAFAGSPIMDHHLSASRQTGGNPRRRITDELQAGSEAVILN